MKKNLILMLMSIIPFVGFCWNSSGHQTCGAVAYYYLKKNKPAVLQKVLATIKLNPWYDDKIWHDKLAGLTDEQKNVSLFMLASTYPDDLRDSIQRNDIRNTWHYVDYPFVPEGDNTIGHPPAVPNAEGKIVELLTTLKTSGESADKSIDLCWLFHLIEDIHQPLHSVSLFSVDFPHGDKGGNAVLIKLSATTQPVKLHSYWDGLVKGNFSNIPANASGLLNNPIYAESMLPELAADKTVGDWIKKESFVYAKTICYKNGAINSNATNAILVDADYLQQSKALGEKRVVLAGIRLAKTLITLYS